MHNDSHHLFLIDRRTDCTNALELGNFAKAQAIADYAKAESIYEKEWRDMFGNIDEEISHYERHRNGRGF